MTQRSVISGFKLKYTIIISLVNVLNLGILKNTIDIIFNTEIFNFFQSYVSKKFEGLFPQSSPKQKRIHLKNHAFLKYSKKIEFNH